MLSKAFRWFARNPKRLFVIPVVAGSGIAIRSQLPWVVSAGPPTTGTSRTQPKAIPKWMFWQMWTGTKLNGIDGKILENISWEELEKHSTREDGWTCINGKVYNLSAFLDYHPGGFEMMMRGVGKDASKLFKAIHPPKVDPKFMIGKCLVGTMTTDPPPSVTSKTGLKKPTLNWSETGSALNFTINTGLDTLTAEHVVSYVKEEKKLTVLCYVNEGRYKVNIDLPAPITNEHTVKVKRGGVVEVSFNKTTAATWGKLGEPLEDHDTFKFQHETDQDTFDVTIEKIEQLSHDVKLFELRVPEGVRMPIPLGYHVYVKKDSKPGTYRPYTVVLPSLLSEEQNNDVQNGRRFYLMVKIYPDGKFTPILGTKKEGDTLNVSLPEGDFPAKKLDSCNNLLMIAAGTGFTPMVRLMYNALDAKDKKNVKLMFFSKTTKDIIWNDQMEKMRSKGLDLVNILSQPDGDWKGLKGRIRKELLEGQLPGKDEKDFLICTCGPSPFTQEVVRLLQEDFGIDKSRIHVFLA